MIHPTRQKEKEEALMQLWNEMEFHPDESTLASYRRLQKNIDSEKRDATRFFSLRRWSQIAAILLVPLLLTGITLLYQNLQQQPAEMVEVFVPKGEQRKITLPDGSVAFINAGSLLVYPDHFGKHERSIYLMGEANFEVTKDQAHPFIVKTNHLQVKVLGTKFNVHAYPEDHKTVTTLENGAVVVQKPDKQELVQLSPDEQLEYNHATGSFTKKKINASLYAGWTKGQLNFVAMTLKDIFASIERVYNVHVIVPPHLNTHDLYTIKFEEKMPLKEVMNILTKTIDGIQYTIEDENIILIKSH